MSTTYHAKYFSHELTKRCASDSLGKFAASLADARVDLNPHQVDAALFAFQSPLSKGALLADEVGLGKTIEAGILLSQKWAERKRRLLIIVPSNLRKQWSQELLDKFFIPSVILESKSFNAIVKGGNANPFVQENAIVICSYQFARTKASLLKLIDWDLVIIDEAHRLRNVYKANSKIANAIKEAVAHVPKVLLTATPLQNTLLELFGLVSLVDDFTFGDIKSFKAQFSSLRDDEDYEALRERIKPICQRTLRRQVLEYVPYTNRHAITEEFSPTEEEQDLYEKVSDYLASPRLYALPSSQRKLMTLILRRLLASSTFAIAGTLGALIQRLEETEKQQEQIELDLQEMAPDMESIGELEDEWEGESEAKDEIDRMTTEQLEQLRKEKAQLLEFKKLADSIAENSKGQHLLIALEKGFAKAREFKAREKAIIFTESTRTQKYLQEILEGSQYKGKLVLFNGSNNDEQSKRIYKDWLERYKGTDRVTGSPTADMRAALVDYFKEEASIMIATEAAAEGINLQFCALVVNYDLPWNPQRIEQRIGRCHRYGQDCDVVVVNFLNKKNAADQRVYQLLTDKFQLFSGVFGASDEVLGTIESGIDFETRINDIYDNYCRHPETIHEDFDQLQQEMETQISERLHDTKRKLLENFDVEVQEKLRIQKLESLEALDRYDHWLWSITKHYLNGEAEFSDADKTFVLKKNPFPEHDIKPGKYKLSKKVEEENIYRLGHPLAQSIIEKCKSAQLSDEEIEFQYTGAGLNIHIVEELRGKSGYLRAQRLTVTTFDTQDHLILAGCCDDGTLLSNEQCQRMFMLPATITPDGKGPPAELKAKLIASCEADKQKILDELGLKNKVYFEQELDKLERWGEDKRATLKVQLNEYDQLIKEAQRAARTTANMTDRLQKEKEKRDLFNKRDAAWKEYEQAAKEIDKEKETLIDDVEKRLEQKLEEERLFDVRWRVS